MTTNRVRALALCALLASGVAHAQVSYPPLRIMNGNTTLGLSFKLKFDGTSITCTGPVSGIITCAAAGGGGSGTVTSIATSAPLGGGTITTTGTLTCPTCITGSPSATGDIHYSTSGGQGQTMLADVAAGSYLRSGGVAAAPLWSTLTLPNTATVGDVLYASATNGIAGLADVAAGSFLRSGGVGVVPSWSTTTWPNAATQGDLLVATGANAIGSVAAVAANRFLQSAGTSTVPAYVATPVFTAGATASGATDFDLTGSTGKMKATAVSTISLIGASTTPTHVDGVGAGTGPTVTVTGNDLFGYVTVLTGTSPTANSIVTTVSFSAAKTTAPVCVMYPGTTNALANQGGVNVVYIDPTVTSTTAFVLRTGTGGLTAATTYRWVYHCGQ